MEGMQHGGRPTSARVGVHSTPNGQLSTHGPVSRARPGSALPMHGARGSPNGLKDSLAGAYAASEGAASPREPGLLGGGAAGILGDPWELYEKERIKAQVLGKDLRRVRQILEDKRKQNESLMGSVGGLEEKVASLEQLVALGAAGRGGPAGVPAKWDKRANHVERQEQYVKQLEKEAHEQGEAMTSYEKFLTEAESKFRKALQAAEKDVQQSTKAKTEANLKLFKAEKRVTELEGELEVERKALAKSRAKARKMDAWVITLKSENKGHRDAELGQAHAQIAELRRALEKTMAHAEKVSAEVDGEREARAGAERRAKKAETDLKATRESLAESYKQRDRFQAAVAASEAKLEEKVKGPDAQDAKRLRGEVKRLHEEKDEEIRKRKAAEDALEAAKAEVLSVSASKNPLEAKVKALKRNVDDGNALVIALRQKLEEREAEYLVAMAEVQDAAKAREKVEAKLKGKAAEAAEAHKLAEEEMERGAKEEQRKMEEEAEGLRASLEAKEQELSEAAEASARERERLEGEVRREQERGANLEAKLEEANAKVGKMEAQLSEAEERLSCDTGEEVVEKGQEAVAKVQMLRAKDKELEALVNDLKADKARVEAALAEKDAEVKGLHASAESLRAELAHTKHQLAMTEDKITEIISSLEGRGGDI